VALGLGFALDGRELKGFSLSRSTGSLLAGLRIGALLEVPVSGTAKSVLSCCSLFSLGYSVGPKLAKAIKGDGWDRPLFLWRMPPERASRATRVAPAPSWWRAHRRRASQAPGLRVLKPFHTSWLRDSTPPSRLRSGLCSLAAGYHRVRHTSTH